MTSPNLTQDLPKKPIPLRITFILNALMMVLPFVFYGVFISQNIQVGTLDPQWFLYTGAAYIASFAFLVSFILKRNFTGFRTLFFVNFVIAIPAGAYIGMVIALVSFGLSFNQKIKAYFLVD
ncbi:hypothetical protein OA92_12990 [Marinomonas sp. SBI22]|uniref:hypothetical protein n=1 Tax=unclassified Marinomonas TaxID=196814 RepID=UPI0007AF2CFF|nr:MULTISPECIES: hypothetical protein [unclassified Marinomonas]KZM42124.1 hypothetical protein OA92_12990 [Marinomonas sp. SBI22]KZM47032.1 hypothetical protein OA91_00415 [Marinomonas sp. SBI8L]